MVLWIFVGCWPSLLFVRIGTRRFRWKRSNRSWRGPGGPGRPATGSRGGSSLRSELSRLGAYAAHLATAPVVLILLSPVDGLRDTEFDIGRMAQSITLVAASMSLGSCLVSLYPEENSSHAAALVGAESGWTARHAIALGHPDEPRVTGRRAIRGGRHDTAELLRFY